MRIGSISVCSIVDGEMRSSAKHFYPTADLSTLARYPRSLDRASGDVIVTIGSYLIRSEDRVILVDAGVGPVPKSPPVAGGALRSSLLAHGVTPDEVTDVVYTHLHFDHIGWSTVQGEPFFSNATYRCDRRDWDHFMAADYDTGWEEPVTYVESDAARVRLAPLVERMVFFEGSEPILPGIESLDAAGHTPGSVVLMISSGGQRGALLGDLIHSQPELIEGWTFLRHVDPEQALNRLVAFRDQLADEAIPCSASHFPGLSWGRVERVGSGFCWVDIEQSECCASIPGQKQ